MQNSERFLTQFNEIQQHLRILTGLSKNESFYQLVEEASKKDAAVRRYAVDLKEFADLRNAIVHERTDAHLIAEPNDRAVSEIEAIVSLLLKPPTVGDHFRKSVLSLSATAPVSEAIQLMYKHAFSQIPIYRGDQCTALLTSNTVARWLGSSLAVGMVSLEEDSIEDVLVHREEQELFRFLPREATVFEALQHFERETKQGKSLIALLITQNGKSSEKLLGMMALWDLPLAHALVSLSRK